MFLGRVDGFGSSYPQGQRSSDQSAQYCRCGPKIFAFKWRWDLWAKDGDFILMVPVASNRFLQRIEISCTNVTLQAFNMVTSCNIFQDAAGASDDAPYTAGDTSGTYGRQKPRGWINMKSIWLGRIKTCLRAISEKKNRARWWLINVNYMVFGWPSLFTLA